jgi:hypothetical protein
MRTLRVSSASSGIASSVAEQLVEQPQGLGELPALDRAREIEGRAHPLLADDRASPRHAHAPVVGSAGQRSLARLAQQARAVVADPLHQQPRGVVGRR